MGKRIDSLPFEGWVRHTFDHPAPGPEWYFDLDAPFWAGPASLTIAYVTKLFEDPCPVLAGYTVEQLNRGFWYLLSTEVARIIDEFLARTANARAELLAYARSARGGCVL